MILTTTLLIVVTVVGSGVLNVMNIRRAFDESAKQQIEVFRTGRETAGDNGTPLFARAVEQLLIDRGRDADILSLVHETVGAVLGVLRDGLKLAYVLDLNQKLVAHCFEEAKLDCAAGNHEKVSAARGQLTVDTWNQALAAILFRPQTWPLAARFGTEAIIKRLKRS